MVFNNGITHLNRTISYGGAAKAAGRINDALNEINENSMLINLDSKKYQIENSKSIFNRNLDEKLFKVKYGIYNYCTKNKLKKFQVKSGFDFSLARYGLPSKYFRFLKDVDIINLHWINNYFFNLKTFKYLIKLNKPVYWTIHDSWIFTGGCHVRMGCKNYINNCGNCPILNSSNKNDLSYKLLTQKSSIFNDLDLRIISPSKWLANEARLSPLLTNKEIIHIPNPITNEKFFKLDKCWAKKALNLDPSFLIIGFGAVSAESVPYKGYDKLIESLNILSQLLKGDAKVGILIFGVNDIKGIRNLNQFPTKILGHILDDMTLNIVYNAMDVFVTPSLDDNFPSTILESMLTGTPVVGFTTGGIPEIIQPLKNGYLANYGDTFDLAYGIYQILNMSSLEYNKMSDYSITYVSEHFNYNLIAKRYLNFYTQNSYFGYC